MKKSAMLFWKRFLTREDGAVVIMLSFVLVFVFFPILAVTTELGLRTMEQRKLQHQADVAAYSASVAWLAVDQDPSLQAVNQCPPNLVLEAGYFAAHGSGFEASNPRISKFLRCGSTDEIKIVSDSHTRSCNVASENSKERLDDGFFGLCVRLSQEQPRLFSRLFLGPGDLKITASAITILPNVVSQPDTCLLALAETGHGIDAGDGITVGGNFSIDVLGDCVVGSNSNIRRNGNNTIIGPCVARTIDTGACTSTTANSTVHFIDPLAERLSWVENWDLDRSNGICTAFTLPSSNILEDGAVYCINEHVLKSGAGSSLTGGKNMIIVGPQGSLRFEGNSGFSFDALTKESTQNQNISGVSIYSPFSDVVLGGNSQSSGCGGVIARRIKVVGTPEFKFSCDREKNGSVNENLKKGLQLAY
jgi:hypothetical protein